MQINEAVQASRAVGGCARLVQIPVWSPTMSLPMFVFLGSRCFDEFDLVGALVVQQGLAHNAAANL